MFCKECGTQLVSDARFCLNCGKALDEVMLKELEEENRVSEEDNLKKEYENAWANRNEVTKGINGTSLVEDSDKTVIPVYNFSVDKENVEVSKEESVELSSENDSMKNSDSISPILPIKPVFMNSVADVDDSKEINIQENVNIESEKVVEVVTEPEQNIAQKDFAEENVSATEDAPVEPIETNTSNTFDVESVDKILSIISEGNRATAIGFNSINIKLNMILELLKKQEERQAVSEEQISEVKKTIKGIKITFEE